MTDPYLYRRLSQAIVLMNLKGCGGLDVDKLRTLIDRETLALQARQAAERAARHDTRKLVRHAFEPCCNREIR